jgi:hypothetical protein
MQGLVWAIHAIYIYICMRYVASEVQCRVRWYPWNRCRVGQPVIAALWVSRPFVDTNLS